MFMFWLRDREKPELLVRDPRDLDMLFRENLGPPVVWDTPDLLVIKAFKPSRPGTPLLDEWNRSAREPYTPSALARLSTR